MRNDEQDRRRDAFDLDTLLHPAQAFGQPSEVLADPDLTPNEKRAILKRFPANLNRWDSHGFMDERVFGH